MMYSEPPRVRAAAIRASGAALIGVVLAATLSSGCTDDEVEAERVEPAVPAPLAVDPDLAAKAQRFADKPVLSGASASPEPDLVAHPDPVKISGPTTAGTSEPTPVEVSDPLPAGADAGNSLFAGELGAPARGARVFELRLAALAERVRRMHEAWSAESDEWSERAMELEKKRLTARLDPVVTRLESRATVSVHVRHLQAQRVLYDHNGSELRNPASNQKMLTAAAALDLLGPEYRFETRVSRTRDTLYLAGSGDPTLTIADLTQHAQELVRDFDFGAIGRLVIDESAFSTERFVPDFAVDDIGLAYAAPSGALSANDNVVAISLSPTSPGQPLRVRLDPDHGYLRLDLRGARTIAADAGETAIDVRTRAEGEQTVVEIRGQMREGDKPLYERRRIYDPGMFVGQAFAAALAQATGRPLLPIERGVTPKQAHLLRSWSSLPLVEVVRTAMAYSNNFAIEQILRTIAWRLSGLGSFDEGKRILELYWNTVGVTPTALVVESGSGLSREGRFTARGLVDLLSAAHLAQAPNSGLLAVLPVAGQPGTLRNRQLHARGRLRAKTGTLDGVSALSGVLTTVEGEPVLAFSIMLNPSRTNSLDVGVRHAAEEAIVRVLLEHIDERRARETARHRRQGGRER